MKWLVTALISVALAPSIGFATPVAALDRTQLDFGSTFVRESRTRVLTVRNDGDAPFSVTGVSFPVPLFSQTNDCTAPLAPGQSCRINVSLEMEPMVSAGTIGSWLNTVMYVLTDAPQGTLSLTLFSGVWGRWTVEPAVRFSGTAVGTSATMNVRLRNLTSEPLDIYGMRIAHFSIHEPSPFSLETDCNGPVAPLGTCNIAVTFTPTQLGNSIPSVILVSASLSGELIYVDGTGVILGDDDGDGIPSLVESAEGTDPTTKDNDVFASPRLFVMQQYRDFLGREGDAAGIAYWTQELTSGRLNRGDVAERLMSAPEFSGRMSPVARLYLAYFLRTPDYPGLSFWAARHAEGASLADISAYFAQSGEFAGRYGSLDNVEFVELLYRNTLDRQGDGAGLRFWAEQLDASLMSRGDVMLQFSESAEFRQLSANEVFLTLVYTGMLRRTPDSGGFRAWLSFLDSGQGGRAMIDAVLGTTEYRHRFLP
jgi:hypothetical protein